MSKKLNLILAGLFASMSLSTLGSDHDSEVDFLSYDRLTQQSVAAVAAGGALGYALSKDKGTGAKATITLGLGALFGWCVYTWQHRKTLAGARNYVAKIAVAVDTDDLVKFEGMSAETDRDVFLLSQWKDAVDNATKLQEKIESVSGYDDIFVAGKNALRFAAGRIETKRSLYASSKTAAKDSVRAYQASIAGQIESLKFAVNGGYPSRTIAPVAKE